MERFEDLRQRLTMSEDGSLTLDDIPMILMPRWFFAAILRQVEEIAGREAAERIFYAAGCEGADKWVRAHMEKMGLSGKAVMAQYLGSAGRRGWGRFEILEFAENEGRGRFRLHHSAVAEETGNTGSLTCIHLPGSVAGAFQAILDCQGIDLKVHGREIKCRSRGDDFCEFAVEPAPV
jgi:predicted hydrocarbon binding protein